MTYDDIAENFPEIESAREKDKYNYRYPMGESYYDLVQRLEPVIMELEKRDCAVVICHQAVARCILAYFLEEPCDKLPYLRVPLHTLIKLQPKPYGCDSETIKFDINSVDKNIEKSKSDNESETNEEAEVGNSGNCLSIPGVNHSRFRRHSKHTVNLMTNNNTVLQN